MSPQPTDLPMRPDFLLSIVLFALLLRSILQGGGLIRNGSVVTEQESMRCFCSSLSLPFKRII